MSGAHLGWAVEAMIASTLLMALVLLVRPLGLLPARS